MSLSRPEGLGRLAKAYALLGAEAPRRALCCRVNCQWAPPFRVTVPLKEISHCRACIPPPSRGGFRFTGSEAVAPPKLPAGRFAPCPVTPV
jgi:hypothetical protein